MFKSEYGAMASEVILFVIRHVVLFCSLLIPSIAFAQPISLAEVVQATLSNHPDIPLGELQTSSAQIEQQRISGMLDPRVSARAGASDEKSPTTSPFAATQTKSSQFSGSINQPLSDGSSLTGSLNYTRNRLSYPASVPTAFQSTLNPIYSNQIDLTYRYPLLRGHGNPAYHELLNAAANDEASARWQVDMLKEGLARQAVLLYYQLAIEELNLKISTNAIARAEKLLKYQRSREQFGLIEKADRLQADALLATRQLEKRNTEAAVAQARTALNRLMTQSGDQNISPSTNEPMIKEDELSQLDIDSLIASATEKRPIFSSLKARMDAANARFNVAEDQHDTQIDLVGQVGSRALENSAGKAFGQGFNLNDRFVAISVELSDTLNGNATHAGIRQAELARQQIMLEKVQATESVTSELSTVLNQLNYGIRTLKAAEERVSAESQKFNAEIERYKEGRTNTANIIQFEGDLNGAELQAALQKTSLQMATQQLKLAEGTLLPEIFGAGSELATSKDIQ